MRREPRRHVKAVSRRDFPLSAMTTATTTSRVAMLSGIDRRLAKSRLRRSLRRRRGGRSDEAVARVMMMMMMIRQRPSNVE